ncbi:uroporphyrinogen-III synthase [Sneathiella sp.]|uniref:uroporphyrinogen-III synthase n=1 Tax=Sneathiella sp. TaxID=1964365 RepID=UPI0039E41ADC
MKLLITRPREAGDQLEDKLKALGFEAVRSPLLTINFLKPKKLALDGVQALLVTSINGVKGFTLFSKNRDLPVYAVGERTATEAKKAGFPLVFSANGDVDGLASLIKEKVDPAKGPLLHVGGVRLAGDLKGMLTEVGFRYRREILYQADEIKTISPEAVSALEEGSLDGVLLFSPQTAIIFAKNIEQAGLTAHLKTVTAWCLSKNVADQLTTLPFKGCQIAVQPTETALIEAIEREKRTSYGMSERGISEMTDKQDEEKSGMASESEQVEINADETVDDSGLKKPLPNSLKTPGDMPTKEAKKSSLGMILLLILFAFLLGVAAWPILYPKAKPYLPQIAQDIVTGYFGESAANEALQNRLSALEERLNSQPDASAQTESVAMNALNAVKADLAALSAKIGETGQTVSAIDPEILAQIQGANTRLTDVETSVEAIKEQLLAIEGKILAADMRPSAPVETVIAQPAPEILAGMTVLQKAVDDVKSNLAALERDVKSADAETEASKAQLAALSSALQAQLDAQAAQNGNADEALMLLGLGQLQTQSRGDAPFDGAVRQTLNVAHESMHDDLTALLPVAARGATPLSVLKDEFRNLANEIVQAERLPASDTWYGKTLHNLATLVKFRRVDDLEGESVDAIVAKAENALNDNNLGQAIDALNKLSGAPSDVAAGWLSRAEERHLVDRTVDMLLGKATATVVETKG